MTIELKLVNKGKSDIWMDMYDIELARDMAKSFDCAELYIDDKLIEKYINGEIVK